MEEFRVKIVGNRTMKNLGLKDLAVLQRLMVKLRGNRPFIPKGVYRFKTFEEAEEWTIKMLSR